VRDPGAARWNMKIRAEKSRARFRDELFNGVDSSAEAPTEFTIAPAGMARPVGLRISLTSFSRALLHAAETAIAASLTRDDAYPDCVSQ
jgi:hypothetical protein